MTKEFYKRTPEYFPVEKQKNGAILGPPQTGEIVVDNYFVLDHKKLSITKKPVCEASYR